MGSPLLGAHLGPIWDPIWAQLGQFGTHLGPIRVPFGAHLGPIWDPFGTLFGVGDGSVAGRVRQALDHDLKPVLCIGETLEQREGGETRQVVSEQLETGLSLCKEGEFPVVAYEPVWAIGTGVTATVEQVAEVHGFLRNRLCELRGEGAQATPILYGGSVKAENANDLLGLDDVDGALVGGASLEAESFLGIVDAGFACRSGRRPETS